MNGVEHVVRVHIEAVSIELVRVAPQELGQQLAAVARPDVPHRTSTPVAAPVPAPIKSPPLSHQTFTQSQSWAVK